MGAFSKLAVVLIGTAATAFGILLVYRHYDVIQKHRQSKSHSAMQEASPAESSSPSFTTCSGNNDHPEASVSSEEIQHLVSMLSAANTTKFYKIMRTLIQFSNDNTNIVRYFTHLLPFLAIL